MKFISITLAACAGFALAAPTQREYIQPGGDHDYHSVARSDSDTLSKRVASPVKIAVWKVIAGAIVTNFLAKTIGERVLNDIYGKQTKRDVPIDATFDCIREAFVARYTQALLDEYTDDGTADAAVCTGVGYYISTPKATLWEADFELQGMGQQHEYDCFLLAGPVTIDVGNATSTDFAYAAPANSTYENGILTIE